MSKKFKSPKEAEKSFAKLESNSSASINTCNRSTINICESVQTDIDPSTVYYLYDKISAEVKLEVMSKLFSTYMASDMCVSVPGDFLTFAAKAMMNLKSSGRTNVLYNLAKGMGSLRADGATSRFPTDRMPMGLIEYTASFYVCDNVNQVSHYNRGIYSMQYYWLLATNTHTILLD